MIKQRILGLALAFALIASAGLGFARQASADNTVLITASVASILSLSVDDTTVDFGTVDILGHGGIAEVVDRCALANGFRYVSKDVHVTVQSSSPYNFGMTYGGGSTASLTDGFTFYVNSGNYGNCATLSNWVDGLTLRNFWLNYGLSAIWSLDSPPTGTTGVTYIQNYALDVTTSMAPSSPSPHSLSVGLTYVVVPTV